MMSGRMTTYITAMKKMNGTAPGNMARLKMTKTGILCHHRRLLHRRLAVTHLACVNLDFKSGCPGHLQVQASLVEVVLLKGLHCQAGAEGTLEALEDIYM